MTTPRIASIVLAAGGSSRMEGRHKLLERVGDGPLLLHGVRAALAFGGPVVVVTGGEAAAVESHLPAGVRVVRNPAWTEGMSTSIRAGVEALPAGVDAAFVLLADMPAVEVRHLRELAARWVPGAIVVPTHDGVRGNPVLWSAEHFPELARLEGDRGGKPLLNRHADAVVEVSCDSAGSRDVDDATDLERERADVPVGS